MKAREIAFKVLCDIEENNNYSNIAINKHFKNYQVTKEEVERCKKVWISSEVMTTDNVEATISALINDIIDGKKDPHELADFLISKK